MTAIVGFLCRDGVVIGADGMLTPSLGGAPVGHHKGKKLHAIHGHCLSAYAGDQGMATRFRYVVESASRTLVAADPPMKFLLEVSARFSTQLERTKAAATGLETMLAFGCDGGHALSVFDGDAQPLLLDADSFYAALGATKTAADPFLRFLVDIFCSNGPPPISDAIFLTLWTLQHVIDAGPGGAAEPISIGVLHHVADSWRARIVSVDDLQEHREAIGSATSALRVWRRDASQNSMAAPATVPLVPSA